MRMHAHVCPCKQNTLLCIFLCDTLMRACVRYIARVRPCISTVVEGKCLPCDAIACGLGYYRAMCQYDQTDGLCRKCPYELPPNSEWDIKSPNCSWTCAQGYEKTVT